MSSIVSSEYKPSLLDMLKGLHKWAFPHWILWALAIGASTLNLLWTSVSPHFTMEPSWFVADFIIAFFAFNLMVFRSLRPEFFGGFTHRIWMLFLGLFFSAIFMNNMQLLSHLIMSTNLPMADDTLMRWDRSLGFDWLAYAKWLTSSPQYTAALLFAYGKLSGSGLMAVAAVAIVIGNRARIIEVFYLISITALTSIIIAAWFPARATMDLLGDQELHSRLAKGVGTIHIDQLMEVRSAAHVFISGDSLQGLVSFPSFHTCMALIIAISCRVRWYTFIPGCMIAIAILIGTPIFGGHYLVDLIGGAVITAISFGVWVKFILPNLSDKIANSSNTSITLPHKMKRRGVPQQFLGNSL